MHLTAMMMFYCKHKKALYIMLPCFVVSTIRASQELSKGPSKVSSGLPTFLSVSQACSFSLNKCLPLLIDSESPKASMYVMEKDIAA
jgi:predicted permease